MSPTVIKEGYFRPIQEISIPPYAALERSVGTDCGLIFNEGHGPVTDQNGVFRNDFMRPDRDDSALMHAHFFALHAFETLCKWFDVEPLRGEGPSGLWERYEAIWSDKRKGE